MVVGEDVSGLFECLSAGLGGAFVSGCRVEACGPVEFRGGVAVPAFVEEAAADLVADERFPGGGMGQAEGLFLEQCRFVPLVLVPVCVGEDEQGPELLFRSVQELVALNDGLSGASEQRECPDAFDGGVYAQAVFHRGPVQNNIAEGARVRPPDLRVRT